MAKWVPLENVSLFEEKVNAEIPYRGHVTTQI